MKVDVYSIMHNDIKILPYFLRHYGSFVDRIFVWDDDSDDGTREMLESHPKVKVIPFSLGRVDNLYFVQKLWPQYINSRGYADWVICVECDEFVYHPNILGKLEELKSNGINKVRCSGFVMYHPELPKTQGQIYDEVKLGIPDDKVCTKTILINPNIDINWTVGRHHCSKERFVATDTGIIIMHFRLLGYDYYIERARRNLRYSSKPEHLVKMTTSRKEFGKMISNLPFRRVVE